jgi:hypothetical protein
MSDELNFKPQLGTSMIINFDTSNKSGSHWVALHLSKKFKRAYYFDPFGLPPLPSVEKFVGKIPLEYNKFQIQDINDVICGELSIAFIKLMNKGFTFNEVINMFKIK